MTLTESELAFDLNLLLDNEKDPEPGCDVRDCSMVALWELIMERPCKCAPYRYCEAHTAIIRRENVLARVQVTGWFCEAPPTGCGAPLGRLLRIEPIKRG